MKSNTQLFAVAKSQLGKGGATFRKYTGLSSGQPWCDAFVFWLFNANGCKELLPWTGRQRTYCPASIKWCEKNLAQIPPYLAMQCDIIYFDWERNGVPNHIGLVWSKKTTATIYTLEGNTSGGKVDDKNRDCKYVQAVFRPHFKASFNADKKLIIDGDYAYNSIAITQKALKALKYYNGAIDGILGQATIRGLQGLCGATKDGAWGSATSGKLQTYLKNKGYYTGKIDKAFGKQSVTALQKWANANAFPSVSGGATTAPKPATTSNAQKIVNMVNELAWPYGTSSSKWDYKKGAPTAKCKAAMKKFGYTTKGKMSSCIYAVNTVIRSTGINKSFCAGHGYNKPYPKTEAGFNTVLSGKSIPSGFLKPGDVVRYKKTGKDEHTLIYMGNNRIAEARHYHRFFNIYKDEKRYNGSNVKKSTLQVLRAK